MVEKGKFYYETPCEVCGQFHRGALVEWDDCDGPGGSRTGVTIDYEAVAADVNGFLVPFTSGRVRVNAEMMEIAFVAALVEGGNQ